MSTPTQLAQSVLAADGQPFATLSLAEGLPPVTADTAVADARRSYMRLAGLIHPDRLQGTFDKATEAFQCLVRAFETFADPKSRKKAVAELAKKAKAADKTRRGAPAAAASAESGAVAKQSRRASPTAKKAEKVKAKKPPKKQPKTTASKQRRRAPDSEEESDEEEEEESDASESEASAAEEDAWEELAAANAEPEVSTSRTPIGQPRVGGLYQPTTVGCPKCRSLWEPDSKPQYSLFMGHWGKKVHCQLCLFHFGCATALHSCPHCTAPVDYDVSMYDEVQTCRRCKKQFGFPYYPVSQHLIDQITLEEWREAKERAKASEREARARARRGNHDDHSSNAGGGESEEAQQLIGACIVDEACPLCGKRVKSQHRSHVLACMAKTPAERKAAKAAPQQESAVVEKKRAPSRTAKAAPKAAPKKAAKPTPKKAAPKVTAKAAAKKRRRRGGSSSDEDEESELSESEDELSSESSFSDEDDDDDSD